MRARHVVLAIGLAASLALVAFGDGEPAPAAGAAPHWARPRVARSAATEAPWVMRVLPRDELVGDGSAAGDGAFRSQSWTPPPDDEQVPEPAEPAPLAAPPMAFRYIGKALGADGWEVFLAEGDAVHVARPNDVIAGAYRVTAIVPPSMSLLYLPLNQELRIDIGASQ